MSDIITLKAAYKAIRAWYKLHKSESSRLGRGQAKYIARSTQLIDALPSVNIVTDLEIRAVLQEVIMGFLEWAFCDSDGKYKMSEYAKLALEARNFKSFITPDELAELTSSWIMPYIKR
jgi:hypothetical protein